MTWLLPLAGCWPDIRGPDYEPYDTANPGARVTHEDQGDGVTLTVVDAADPARWVFVDLDAEDVEELEVDEEADGWDVAFSRQRIKLDGGVSGDGGVEVAVVEAATLEDLASAPTDGYVTDLPDDDLDENSEPEYAFDLWFDYDPVTHVLSPHDYVFVVRTTDLALVAIEVVSYYDEAGSSGLMQFRWRTL